MDGDSHRVCITAYVEGRTGIGVPVYTDKQMTAAPARGWQRDALPPMLIVYSDLAIVRERKGSGRAVEFAGVAASTRDAQHGTCAVAIYGVCGMHALLPHAQAGLYPTCVLQYTDARGVAMPVHGHVEMPALEAGAAVSRNTVGTLCQFGSTEHGPHQVLIMVGVGSMPAAAARSAPAATAALPVVRTPESVCAQLTCSHLDRLQCLTSTNGILRSKIAVYIARNRADGGVAPDTLIDDVMRGELVARANEDSQFWRELCDAVDVA